MTSNSSLPISVLLVTSQKHIEPIFAGRFGGELGNSPQLVEDMEKEMSFFIILEMKTSPS